ncbi:MULTISPECIES: hypothetical protein [Nocardia]|uniref:Uncharacterized protein n=1 Tax=Nocardia nova TaxID=37330 RepID=A0A2T2Z8D0_9NOCA|nr:MULTISPECIES: hypothetical protein [Nocardia]PSR64016.1 hypothetical protein C8259_09225 [Nocardia nova]
MSTDRDRVAEVLSRIDAANARIERTGELGEQVGGGRAPSRSATFKCASADLHIATQARNQLLIDMVGDAESVPAELAAQLRMTGRHAASVLQIARTGTEQLQRHTFGFITTK